MTANTLEVSISPDVMKWVIDTSGREIAEIAKKIGVTESAVRGWTRKSHKISVAKLENLSKYVKRPLAVFLLKNPPSSRRCTTIGDCRHPTQKSHTRRHWPSG